MEWLDSYIVLESESEYNYWLSEEKKSQKEYIEQLELNSEIPIVIFGCGQRGRQLYQLLNKNDIVVSAFCDNNAEFWNKDFFEINILNPKLCCDLFLNAIYIVAIAGKYDIISKQLSDLGIKKENHRYFEYSTTELRKRARIWYFQKFLKNEYLVNRNYSQEANYFGVKKNEDKIERYFRILADENLGCEFELQKEKHSVDLLNDFEKVYGKYRKLEEISKVDSEDTVAKILVACCHKDKSAFADSDKEYFIPIQVGAKLTTERIYDLTDDIGETISDRNFNYCECTALYWAWKNQWENSSDYIGLRHYRRKLDITEEQLKKLKSNRIDMVLMAPTYLSNISKHFAVCTKNQNDWMVMKEAIGKLYPEYSDSFTILEKQHFLCQCNMFVMKRNLFDNYCEFLFSILVYIENYYNSQMERNDRYLGYLAEVLLSLYAIHNFKELNIAYADMQMV